MYRWVTVNWRAVAAMLCGRLAAICMGGWQCVMLYETPPCWQCSSDE